MERKNLITIAAQLSIEEMNKVRGGEGEGTNTTRVGEGIEIIL